MALALRPKSLALALRLKSLALALNDVSLTPTLCITWSPQSEYVPDFGSREKYRSSAENAEDGEQPQTESVDDHCRELPLTADLLRVGVLTHSSGQVPHLAEDIRQQRTLQHRAVVRRPRGRSPAVYRDVSGRAVNAAALDRVDRVTRR